ncbi:hypothetical protein ACFQ1S_05640 [Kibdelosporangium lantanae]|uniref:Uncharacterized protein n=1 Tax=Kibdelosporangium lantanae TaxID=1497396 RepID=A0ABW3M677_9PSEU
MGGLRDITAMVVAAESPIGRVIEAIELLTSHLPPVDQPAVCSLCSPQSWPCPAFDAAAEQIQAGAMPIGYLVPLDLHPRLWPASPDTPPPHEPVVEQGAP